MSDPLALSARDTAEEIVAGRLGAEELVAVCLDRIAARKPIVGRIGQDAQLMAAARFAECALGEAA